MRNFLLQVAAAFALVLIAIIFWRQVGRDGVRAAVPAEISTPYPSDVFSSRSGLPRVIDIDPAGFLPVPLCRTVEKPLDSDPLNVVAEEIGRIAGLPCRIDESELREGGADGDTRVTMPAGMPLYMALDQLCFRHQCMEPRGRQLDWYVDDGVIAITTATAAEDRMLVHGFDASQILRLWNGDRQSIIDVLQAHCGFDCIWMDIDGVGGEIDFAGNVLMVRQSYRMLRKVAALLDAMQRRAETIRVDHAPRDANLFEVLNQPVNGWFQGIPLETAIASLSEQCGITLEIAAGDLEDDGVLMDDAVFCELRDQPLGLVLDTMLHDVQGAKLSYIVRDGIVWITTKNTHDDHLERFFYHVGDLLRVMREQQLIDLIQSQVDGEWIDIDGFGGDVDVMPDTYLIVSAPRASQEETAELLATLRGSLVMPDADNPNAMISRTYLLSATLAEDLESVLLELVSPESWYDPYRLPNSGQGRVYSIRIDASHTSLVIHQTLDNHRQIDRLLDRIDPRGLGHWMY